MIPRFYIDRNVLQYRNSSYTSREKLPRNSDGKRVSLISTRKRDLTNKNAKMSLVCVRCPLVTLFVLCESHRSNSGAAELPRFCVSQSSLSFHKNMLLYFPQ